MSLAAKTRGVRTPSGVPCARHRRLHFTPHGMSRPPDVVTINMALLTEGNPTNTVDGIAGQRNLLLAFRQPADSAFGNSGGLMKSSKLFSLVLVVLLSSLAALAQGSGKVVKVSTGESVYKVKRGSPVQIAVVVEVEDGYHINSNRPAEKYLIPTALKIERLAGLSTTPIIYPKARLQKFEFSEKQLSVFEGKAVLKLSARALPALPAGSHTLKGKLTVQACNNQQCLRPQTIDVSIPLQVE